MALFRALYQASRYPLPPRGPEATFGTIGLGRSVFWLRSLSRIPRCRLALPCRRWGCYSSRSVRSGHVSRGRMTKAGVLFWATVASLDSA